MARQYREEIPLPRKVDLGLLADVTDFIENDLGGPVSSAHARTSDGDIDSETLAPVIEEIRMADGLDWVEVDFAAFDDDVGVKLTWFHNDRVPLNRIVVTGSNQSRVLGAAESIRRRMARMERDRRRQAGTKESWLSRRRDEVSVQVAGSVIGGAILAIGGAVWALFIH